MDFDNNNHSVFKLHYHLIMCVKYRRKVIDDAISNRLQEFFSRIAEDYNIAIDEWHHDIDHVHVLFRGQPNAILLDNCSTYLDSFFYFFFSFWHTFYTKIYHLFEKEKKI